jgi:hypothetical protein
MSKKHKNYNGRTKPTIMLIPDTQAKPDAPNEHMAWAGEWAAEKKPDYIIHIGDHWDMASLSMYDKGKKSYEGRTIRADLDAGIEAMELFMAPINAERARLQRNKKQEWNPEMHFFLGNHEERIMRAINNDRMLDGLVGYEDLELDRMGWTTHEFNKPAIIEGIAFSHYFTSGAMGRAVSSARALVTKKHMSCVMGHVQQTEIDISQKRADGKQLTGLFAGIFYQHDESYLGPQGNEVRRQVWMFYNVDDGQFDLHALSLDYLRKRYGKRI